MDVPDCLQLPNSGFCLFGLSHDVYCSTTVSGFFVMVISWLSDRCFVMMTAGGCLRNPVGDKRAVGYIKCVISDTLVLSNRSWRNRELLIMSDDNHGVNECKARLAGNPYPEATSDLRAHKSDASQSVMRIISCFRPERSSFLWRHCASRWSQNWDVLGCCVLHVVTQRQKWANAWLTDKNPVSGATCSFPLFEGTAFRQ